MAQRQGNEATEARSAPRQLGALEGQLMEVLWGTPATLTVQEVVERLEPGHNYKTVMTVLNRLVEKELLERQLDGRAYRYRPHVTRDQFLRSVADDLVHGYLQTYGDEGGVHLTQAVGAVLPHNTPAPAPPPPPPPPQYYDLDEDRRPPILAIILVAAMLELLVLLLVRRSRRD